MKGIKIGGVGVSMATSLQATRICCCLFLDKVASARPNSCFYYFSLAFSGLILQIELDQVVQVFVCCCFPNTSDRRKLIDRLMKKTNFAIIVAA